jgi:Na+/proline symporter
MKRMVTVRRAIVTVWLLLFNVAAGGLYLLLGESVRDSLGISARGEVRDLIPLLVAFAGFAAIILAWRRSTRAGTTTQVFLPLVVLLILWTRNRPRLVDLAPEAGTMAWIVIGGGLSLTLIIVLHSAFRRRRADSNP